MPSNDRVARLRLRFETSQQDINRAKSAVGSLIQEIDQLEAQQRELDAQYARSLQVQIANARALDQNSSFVNSLRADLGNLAEEQENLNRVQQQTNRTTDESIDLLDRYRRAVEQTGAAEAKRVGSVGAGTAGRLEQVDRFGRVGTQVLSGLGQSDAANAVGLVGDVADSFTKLNPVMLGVTAVTTGLAVVYGHLRQETERVTTETAARIQAEAEAARFLATATQTQTRERIQALQEQIRVEEAILEARRREEAEARGQLDAFDALRLTLGIAYGEITAMTAATDESANEVRGLHTELDVLTGSIQNLDPVLGLLEDQLTQLEDFRSTVQYVNQLLYDEKQAQLEAAEAAAEEAAALRDANSEKQKSIELAREEAAIEAEKLRQQGITDTVDQLFKANEEILRLDQEDAEAAAALAKARSDASAAIQKLESDAEQERNANLSEAEDQRAKITSESNDRILDITRKGNAMVSNAIGARDALAAYLAQQNAKEQIADEQKAQQKRLGDLDANLKKQNRLVDQRLQERLQIERQRAEQEIAVRFAAAQRALTNLDNALNAQAAIQSQYNSLMVAESAEAGKAMVVAFRDSISANLANTRTVTRPDQQGYFYTAPQFQGNLAPQQFSNSSNGGLTVNQVINGQTAQQIGVRLRQAGDQLVNLFFGNAS